MTIMVPLNHRNLCEILFHMLFKSNHYFFQRKWYSFVWWREKNKFSSLYCIFTQINWGVGWGDAQHNSSAACTQSTQTYIQDMICSSSCFHCRIFQITNCLCLVRLFLPLTIFSYWATNHTDHTFLYDDMYAIACDTIRYDTMFIS